MSRMTREGFIEALRQNLLERYAWATDHPDTLKRFIDNTSVTMSTNQNHVNIDGPAFVAAWRAVGGRGRPTYKGLRALSSDLQEVASCSIV